MTDIASGGSPPSSLLCKLRRVFYFPIKTRHRQNIIPTKVKLTPPHDSSKYNYMLSPCAFFFQTKGISTTVNWVGITVKLKPCESRWSSLLVKHDHDKTTWCRNILRSTRSGELDPLAPLPGTLPSKLRAKPLVHTETEANKGGRLSRPC